MSVTNKNKTAINSHFLLIKLQKIEFRSAQIAKDYQFVYFSFSIADRFHFSASINPHNTILNDDILIPISQQFPDFISMHRWQNHMIMFTHQIDISQLKTRTTTKKKHETKSGQILSFMIILLRDQQLKLGDKLVQSISQHYFIIQSINVKENKTQMRVDDGPSYYLIKTSNSEYIYPVLDGQLCIKLPQTFEFQHIKNNKLAGKSKTYNYDEFTNSNTEIQLSSTEGNQYILCLNFKWAINLFQARLQNSLLLQAHEIVIYDFEVKFDTYNQYANSRVKFVYGNKAYQIGSQFNTAKPSKIKKIVYFIIKSQDEEISIIVQRNLKIVAQSKFYTDQISSYFVHNPKRKFIDDNGKIVGSIKFKCQKAKSLSTPNNNKFWKQSSKKKLINATLLSIQQISVNYQYNQQVCVMIKSQSQQRTINNIPNFMYFNKNTQISYAPIVMSAKPDESVYMMIKNNQKSKSQSYQNQNDFIGIAILNFAQLRLGSNSTQIQFFKNQAKTASAHCLINKVVTYSFIKSVFQPEIIQSSNYKTMSLSVFMKKVIFTPYFYTFRYDNKNQVYCIVQANRLKKVLIMQSTIHDELTFMTSSSSDSLNFYIQEVEFVKIKITFLVSDVGHQQQIYGSATVKVKINELASTSQGIRLHNIQLKNDFGHEVGQLAIQIHQGIANSIKNKQKKQYQNISGPFKSEIKRVQNDIDKINQNMQIMENSIKKGKKVPSHNQGRRSQQYHQPGLKNKSIRYDHSINYSDKRKQRSNSVIGTNNEMVILPQIKQIKKQNKNNLKDLVNMMKIRKRDPRGNYEQNSNIKSYQARYPKSQRAFPNRQNHDAQFYTQKDSRQNPIDTNFDAPIINKRQIDKQSKKLSLHDQILEYEQKIKLLKNQLTKSAQQQQLDNKMEQNHVQRKQRKNSVSNSIQDMQQFEDNEFFRPKQ